MASAAGSALSPRKSMRKSHGAKSIIGGPSHSMAHPSHSIAHPSHSIAHPHPSHSIAHQGAGAHDPAHHHHAGAGSSGGGGSASADVQADKKKGDLSGHYGKIVFCKRHFHSMTPMRIIFHICGRWPFASQLEAEGYYSYSFLWYYPGTMYFLIALGAMIAVLAIGLCNMAHVTLNSTLFLEGHNLASYEAKRELENVLIKRYYIPLIFVYSSITHGCIAGILVLWRRHYIANYLTFWSRAVHTLHMDVSNKALGFSVKVLLLFILVVTAICLLAVFKVGPTAVGLPTIFGDLTCRLFLKDDDWLKEKTFTRRGVQIFGAVFLVYAFTASKASILFFIYLCKTLRSAFSYWNGRVYAAVLRGGEFAQTEEGRTTYRLLFKDHCVLMDLMEGLDKVAAWTVESYFGCQVFSLFFELYFAIRTAKSGDDARLAAYPQLPQDKEKAFFVRPRDWAAGILMLFVSVSIMYSTIKSAADVSEEAMAGLEVLRRKTMLARKTDDELFFTLSMFSSYTAYKKLELSAGGYFYMNKDFLIGCISSVLSYFIILYQFQPSMDVSVPMEGETRELRRKYGDFLAKLEGLPNEHYDTTPYPGDLWENLRSN